MSGSIDYSLLYPDSSGTGSNTITSLITSLSMSGSGSDPLTALTLAEQNETKDVAATEQQPQVQRTLAAFTAAVSRATSIGAALQNPAVLNVLLTANGMSDQVGYSALAQKALLSDPNDPNSLVNQLSDTRWKTVASNYDFAANGLAALQSPQALAALTQSYAEITWRQSLDATTPGLSEALDFRGRASTINSVDQILGDPVFRSVVTTALGIPPQIAYQDLGAQEQAISSRIDVGRFQDPQFVESMTQQYLIAEQSQASAGGASNLDALAAQAQGLVV